MPDFFYRILGSFFGRMQSAYFRQRYNYFKSRYNIPSSFGFNGTDIRIYGEGELIIGEESYIGSFSTIQIAKNFKVMIGNRCQISHNVRMYTSTLDSNHDLLSDDPAIFVNGNIIIGDGDWIGTNVFINPGITIGANSIIG